MFALFAASLEMVLDGVSPRRDLAYPSVPFSDHCHHSGFIGLFDFGAPCLRVPV